MENTFSTNIKINTQEATADLNNLSDTIDDLHRSANDLHEHAHHVIDRISQSTIAAIPLKFRMFIAPKVTKSYINVTLTSELITVFQRLELLFEDDVKWFQIMQKIERVVQDEQTGNNFINRIMQNTAHMIASGELSGFIKKFMIDLLMLKKTLDRLDELENLSIGCAANLAGKFMINVFESIVKPMIHQGSIDRFLPALDDELKKDFSSQFLQLGKVLMITGVACSIEKLVTGNYGKGAVAAQLLYCYYHKMRRDLQWSNF